MVERFLITTALEETWRTDEPLLYLGKWCQIYSERYKLQRLNYEVVPYHWDDREQLYRDYHYLSDLYENILKSFVDTMNQCHGVEHSIRYWRIVIGPWLEYFIQILFDRWQMVHKAVNENNISGTAVLKMEEVDIIPLDMTHFIYFFSNDIWNHWLYSKILSTTTPVQCYETPITRKISNIDLVRPDRPLYHRLLSLFKRLSMKAVGRIGAMSKTKKQCFIFDYYLGSINKIKLELSLNQFPISHASPSIENIQINIPWRESLKINYSPSGSFEEFLIDILPCQIPRVYLEGYISIDDDVCHHDWPTSPKVIFTSVSHNSDEKFKRWCADKVEQGTKLIIGQHGGHYGAGKFDSTEDHQLAIADKFISYGWKGDDKIIPLPSPKLLDIARRTVSNPVGGLLLIQTTAPRYSYRLWSAPIASQFEDYFNSQIEFAGQLTAEIRSMLSVRLYPGDYGCCQMDRWVDRFPNIQIDSSKNTMYQSIQKARLNVVTYNATAVLETLVSNVPTILLLDPGLWELRDSAREDYDRLRAIGILHDTPSGAAQMINNIWNNVEDWWRSETVQHARIDFCDKYARTSDEWLNEWTSLFKEELASN